MSENAIFSRPHLLILGLNTKIYRIKLCIQSVYGKIWDQGNSSSRQFLHCLKYPFLQYALRQTNSSLTKNLDSKLIETLLSLEKSKLIKIPIDQSRNEGDRLITSNSEKAAFLESLKCVSSGLTW